MMAVRRRVYTGTRRAAGMLGVEGLWLRAATRYVWERPAIDPGPGKVLFQVVGRPRTGTTLLANLINVHPDAYCMSEPYRFFFGRGCWMADDECVAQHPNRFVSRNMRTRSETRVGVKETFFTANQALGWRNQRFFDEMKRLGAVTVVIQRDPRDTYASARESARRGDPTVPDIFTDSWKTFVEWAAKHADVAVTYEALVLEPEKTMAKVLDALGLASEGYRPSPEPMIGGGDRGALAGRSIDGSSVGSYRTRVSREAVMAIEQRCQDEMRALGYL